MEYARYEHETEMLREQLRAREMDRDRQKRDWEMKEQRADEARKRAGEHMRRQQDDMQARMQQQDEELRRRQQENNLFMQAHQLDSMLNEEEQSYEPTTFNANSKFEPKHNVKISSILLFVTVAEGAAQLVSSLLQNVI